MSTCIGRLKHCQQHNQSTTVGFYFWNWPVKHPLPGPPPQKRMTTTQLMPYCKAMASTENNHLWPPLAAVATAAYHQLSDVSTPADVKHSVAHLTAMSGTLDDYDTFRAQLLEALQGYVQTCELPLLISPEAQAQLSQAVLDQSWSDVYFMDVILRCLAVILYTPTVIFTSSLDFPVVHYVPQHLPLSRLHPIYLAMSIEDASMCWLLTPRFLPGAVPTAPMHYPLAADEVHTIVPMPSSTMTTLSIQYASRHQ